jgi:tetratricopeptide (TPR) repeat protein
MLYPLALFLGIVVFLQPAQPAFRPADEGSARFPAQVSDTPSGNASAPELENLGNELYAEKAYAAAIEYYKAALSKQPDRASARNHLGIAEMELGYWKQAIRDFEEAIREDSHFAEAHNNLGAAYYEMHKLRPAIREYQKAIALREDPTFYSNLGSAYFARRDFRKAASAYGNALHLDPDVFHHSGRGGISALLPSPEDRAHFDYVMAKLYAQAGDNDHALIHLRRALEESYRNIHDVYNDQEFGELRKDSRFVQLMASRPAALSNEKIR